AAAVRELLDDPAVGGRDHEDRRDHREREGEREIAVRAELAEGLLGSVRRRREPIRAEADPREERDQRDAVEERRVVEAARPADEEAPEAALRLRARRHLRSALVLSWFAGRHLGSG